MVKGFDCHAPRGAVVPFDFENARERLSRLAGRIARASYSFGRPLRIIGQDFHRVVPKMSRPFRIYFQAEFRSSKALSRALARQCSRCSALA
jgi:hypothetical protein